MSIRQRQGAKFSSRFTDSPLVTFAGSDKLEKKKNRDGSSVCSGCQSVNLTIRQYRKYNSMRWKDVFMSLRELRLILVSTEKGKAAQSLCRDDTEDDESTVSVSVAPTLKAEAGSLVGRHPSLRQQKQ